MTAPNTARLFCYLVLAALAWPSAAHAQFVPPQYLSGSLPTIPVAAVSGGDVFLDVLVDPGGSVATVTVLRATPPFTDDVLAAVRTWRFLPAEDDVPGGSGDGADTRRHIPIEAHVFVGAVFRPPVLSGPTLGDAPTTLTPGSDAVATPIATAVPVYPPNAFTDGIVLSEARVGADGKVESATVLRPAPPFDQPSLEALRQWSFRPPRVNGRPVPARVYVVFAFRQPVTSR